MANPSEKGNKISRRRFVPSSWKKIGEGAFGEVWKVLLDCEMGKRNPYVAVKKLKTQLKQEYYDEKNRLAGFEHPNILKLVGVSPAHNEIPWLVMEYMPRGDLLSCLWNCAGQMPVPLMLKISKGIALGMEYLHDQDEVHGDLAARNILIGEDWTPRIGDFGNNSYRVAYKDDYYDYVKKVDDLRMQGIGNTANSDDEEETKILLRLMQKHQPKYTEKLANDIDKKYFPCPIRWMPPENVPLALGDVPRFNVPGDVWSYGTVLFEIWSGGAIPFENLEDEKVLKALEYAKDTGKFAFNPRYYRRINIRPHIICLMDQCWKVDPERRILFQDIIFHFEEHEPRL